MKAFVTERYGSPDVMKLREVDRPRPGEDRVLVRVRAVSINAYDWHMLRGKPYLARLGEGLRKPKTTIQGVDLAGVVEAVGAGVKDVEPGDEVFGSGSGAFAEYAIGRNFVPLPGGLTFEQAAAIPMAGQTALQGLRDKGQIRPGQRVLINGAGGGVGTFAVQIAKAFGAEVTAVTSTTNVEMVRSIGADEVVDYSREDFTRGGPRYDLVLDVGGNRSLSEIRRVLTPGGNVVLVAPAPGQWIGPIVRVVAAVAMSRFGRRRLQPFLSGVSKADLLALKELAEAGKVRPVIDRTYRFDELPEAIRFLESGKAAGKVVITV